ncbi:MAG: hypothetical protein EOP04_10520 [Proteobacteria bacterium]|nr:MAG: hypothetical protein EOP04_10520 [Pseudomonadota bacterium]
MPAADLGGLIFRWDEFTPTPLILGIFIGIFAADLMTGLIHWVCDSIGSSSTPLWGPALVKPFRDHHREPSKITQISLAENLGASSVAGCVVMALTWPILMGKYGVFLATFMSVFLAFTVWSNLFHRWSHIPLASRPKWMRYLQRVKIILDPSDHLIHHRKPHRVNYCILNGWANSITNRVPWSKLELFVQKLGIRVNFD